MGTASGASENMTDWHSTNPHCQITGLICSFKFMCANCPVNLQREDEFENVRYNAKKQLEDAARRM